jgi:hypothetical protein
MDSALGCFQATCNATTAWRRLRRASGGRAFCVFDDLADGGSEVVHSGAGHYYGIAPTMCFFGNAQKFSPVVLAKLNVKMLALDLKLPGFDDVIHVQQNGGV